MIHGKDIKIYQWGNVIAHATSCSITANADTLECSSATSARAKKYLAGRTDWQINVTKLVSNMQNDLVMVGNTYPISLVVDNTDMLTGTAICVEVSGTYTEGKLSTGSCKFIGSGALI